MKLAIIFAVVLALTLAAPPNTPDTQITKLVNDVASDGFNYNLETSDGTSQKAQGELKKVDAENSAVVVKGSFSYIASDGQQYTVTYVADEKGYQPSGKHLPKPIPVNMKFIVLFVAIFALAAAAPIENDPKLAETLRYENDNIGVDGYHFAIETSDGTSRQETAQLKQIDSENVALVIQGSYQYVGNDGQTYEVKYIADENGFQPQGAHIPVA
uniref:Larval cuticle protein 8 n=1 Tax=Megaselia scalaris TaxID=36166 RepID=T1GUQ0_MEGSC